MTTGKNKTEMNAHYADVPQIPEEINLRLKQGFDLTSEQEVIANAAIAAACAVLRPRRLPGDGARVLPKCHLRTYTGGRVVGGTFQIHKSMEAF